MHRAPRRPDGASPAGGGAPGGRTDGGDRRAPGAGTDRPYGQQDGPGAFPSAERLFGYGRFLPPGEGIPDAQGVPLVPHTLQGPSRPQGFRRNRPGPPLPRGAGADERAATGRVPGDGGRADRPDRSRREERAIDLVTREYRTIHS